MEGLRLEPSPLDQTSTVVFSNFLIFFQMIVASIRLILNDSFKFSSNMIGIYNRRIHQELRTEHMVKRFQMFDDGIMHIAGDTNP
jgi:hypothetical protein